MQIHLPDIFLSSLSLWNDQAWSVIGFRKEQRHCSKARDKDSFAIFQLLSERHSLVNCNNLECFSISMGRLDQRGLHIFIDILIYDWAARPGLARNEFRFHRLNNRVWLINCDLWRLAFLHYYILTFLCFEFFIFLFSKIFTSLHV